jgi:hypothetical protein
VKTKSDLVVMPGGRQIFAFFALRMTVEPKIPGAVIPRRVFTQPGSLGDIAVRRYDVSPIPEKLSLLQTIISARPKFIWTSAGRLWLRGAFN